MICEHEMFELLLTKLPSFQLAWNAFCAEWAGEEDLPIYLALNDIARHLIHKLEVGDTTDFSSVFFVVELWHVDGDDTVRVAATVGLLEDLQNQNLYTIGTPSQFLPWLGPETQRFWKKVEAFWRDGTLITDD